MSIERTPFLLRIERRRQNHNCKRNVKRQQLYYMPCRAKFNGKRSLMLVLLEIDPIDDPVEYVKILRCSFQSYLSRLILDVRFIFTFLRPEICSALLLYCAVNTKSRFPASRVQLYVTHIVLSIQPMFVISLQNRIGNYC
uniref:Uncharacterized protein n=1 Tax=Rhizophagus irregularis (strain DAOM 181602 / DAOM 197198 / MUCL 43194) TaxID=747089 RepID=U9SYF1_RHIID